MVLNNGCSNRSNGFFSLGRVLWWIRTLHIQIRRSRDHFLHVGFLSPPVSDRPTRALINMRNTASTFIFIKYIVLYGFIWARMGRGPAGCTAASQLLCAELKCRRTRNTQT